MSSPSPPAIESPVPNLSTSLPGPPVALREVVDGFVPSAPARLSLPSPPSRLTVVLMKAVVSMTSSPPPPFTFTVVTEAHETAGPGSALPPAATDPPTHVITRLSPAASELIVRTPLT